MYHAGERCYDPRLGRYLQPDPIGQTGRLHLYAYLGNSLLNFADPPGLLLGEAGSAFWSVVVPPAEPASPYPLGTKQQALPDVSGGAAVPGLAAVEQRGFEPGWGSCY